MVDMQEAAERLGVHYQTVRNMILDGRLNAEKVGSAWEISDAQIRDMLNRSGKRMRESVDLSIAVASLEPYRREHSKAALGSLAESCSSLSRLYQEGYSEKLIDTKLNKLAEEIQRYQMLKQVAQFMDDARILANKLDAEAMESLKIGHQYSKNQRKIGGKID